MYETLKAFVKVIEQVRNAGYRKANREDKEVIKGSKYLLLKKKEKPLKKEKPNLKSLLELNEALTTIYVLKDYLEKLWEYRYRKRAEGFLT